MAHIEAKHIGAGVEKLAKHFGGLGRGPEVQIITSFIFTTAKV